MFKFIVNKVLATKMPRSPYCNSSQGSNLELWFAGANLVTLHRTGSHGDSTDRTQHDAESLSVIVCFRPECSQKSSGSDYLSKFQVGSDRFDGIMWRTCRNIVTHALVTLAQVVTGSPVSQSHATTDQSVRRVRIFRVRNSTCQRASSRHDKAGKRICVAGATVRRWVDFPSRPHLKKRATGSTAFPAALRMSPEADISC